LRTEVRKVVERYCDEPIHRGEILRALRRGGFAFHPQAACRAGVLTLQVHRAIAGLPSSAAIRAAAAVELLMEAAFIFDHVADQEVVLQHGLSPAEELGLAIAILNCGLAAACEATHWEGRGADGHQSLLHLLRSCISACTGQFLDAYLERRDSATAEEALAMTSLKAGSLGKLAAEFGARMATDDAETIRLFGEFGINLFTYLQLIDDLRDACATRIAQTDLTRRKKTLPLVFFYNAMLQSNNDNEAGNSSTRLEEEFEASGAGVFCTIAAEAFLNRAKSTLADLRGRVREVKCLEEFIEALVLNAEGFLTLS